jgi:hypothetical protein
VSRVESHHPLNRIVRRQAKTESLASRTQKAKMIFTRPTPAADGQNSRSAVFGRIRASRRANLPRLSGYRRYDGKILPAFKTSAIGHDLDILEPRCIRRLKDERPKETHRNEESYSQTNPMRTLPFSEQSHIIAAHCRRASEAKNANRAGHPPSSGAAGFGGRSLIRNLTCCISLEQDAVVTLKGVGASLAPIRRMVLLSLPKLLFQLGAFIFAETGPNVAAVEASHIIRLETEERPIAHWAKQTVSRVQGTRRFCLPEHHP